MSNESLQRSVLPNNPVDPSIVRVLRTLDPIARDAGCAYFVPVPRPGTSSWSTFMVCGLGATRDIDFGIAIENWERFAFLKERLVATGIFTSDQHALQRLTYADQAAGFSMPVDLIPFRGVTTAGGTIV